MIEFAQLFSAVYFAGMAIAMTIYFIRDAEERDQTADHAAAIRSIAVVFLILAASCLAIVVGYGMAS